MKRWLRLLSAAPLFWSGFSSVDTDWQTRHTPTPDLPASSSAPRVKDGNLVLRLLERDGQVYTSHLATEQTFRYGRFEARMKFASRKGAHSAFWLQDPEPNRVGGSEVDVVEHFGSDSVVWHNVYWRTKSNLWPADPWGWRRHTKTDPREWHVYGLNWYPDRYVYTVDGHVTAVSRAGLSSFPKVLVLSLLSSRWEWPRLDRENLSDYRTRIDWVRVRRLA